MGERDWSKASDEDFAEEALRRWKAGEVNLTLAGLTVWDHELARRYLAQREEIRVLRLDLETALELLHQEGCAHCERYEAAMRDAVGDISLVLGTIGRALDQNGYEIERGRLVAAKQILRTALEKKP